MSQAHDHSHACSHDGGHVHDGSSKRLLFALIVIAAFAVVEVIGGVISGSLALIADAGHMVTDAAALGLALMAQVLARRPATERFPFGMKRAQVLAAFVNALALIAIVGFLIVEGIRRIGEPADIDAPLMLTVAAVGLLANIVAFVLLHPNAGSNVNVRGAMLHVAADIFGSVAAIISALVIMSTGWVVIDPILTFAVCALILRSAIPLVRETSSILLQGAPPEVTEKELCAALEAMPMVVRVDRAQAWQLTPGETHVCVQAIIPSNANPDKVLADVQELLKTRFNIAELTVQLETTDVVVMEPKSVAGGADLLSAPTVAE